MPEANGGTIVYRVGQLERITDKLGNEVDVVRRDVDRLTVHAEASCADRVKLDARLSTAEKQLTDLRIEFAKWAAAGGLVGGLLSQIIGYILQAWGR